MLKEIGSEFWNTEPTRRDKVYLLSGRTALEFIIRDVIRNYHISSVLLPSYCCHTMIEPFCRHGIKVRFYDIFVAEDGQLSADVPEISNGEIFYYMTYFGFHKIEGISIENVRNAAEVIIEDCTHSWLAESRLECSDYSYASYRKWTGLSGIASASKYNGFFIDLPIRRNEKYCDLRREAAALKRNYIEDGIGDKRIFLSLFNEAEELLEEDYIGYAPEPEAIAKFVNIDVNGLKQARVNNASILLDGLKEIDGIGLIFNEISENDVPLFVPILVPSGRTELRRFLIEKSIYCPVHWPLSAYHKGISDRANVLYEQELSIICDQRYTEEDMDRIVSAVQSFWKR